MMKILARLQGWLDLTRKVDFLGPLAVRLYLVPVFWVAGTNKLGGMDNVIAWFGNADGGLDDTNDRRCNQCALAQWLASRR